jgi:hypothetical protein
MKRLALHNVSTEDLNVLIDIGEQGKQQSEWTERESAAIKAFSDAFDQEVLRAGYPSVAAFHRHRPPRF